MKGLKMKNSPSKPIWLHDGQSGCKTAMIGMDFIVFPHFSSCCTHKSTRNAREIQTNCALENGIHTCLAKFKSIDSIEARQWKYHTYWRDLQILHEMIKTNKIIGKWSAQKCWEGREGGRKRGRKSGRDEGGKGGRKKGLSLFVSQKGILKGR